MCNVNLVSCWKKEVVPTNLKQAFSSNLAPLNLYTVELGYTCFIRRYCRIITECRYS